MGDPVQLENLVTNYYRGLFASEGVRDPTPIFGAFPKLSQEDLRLLEKEITCGDIFNVVSHMGSFKALAQMVSRRSSLRVNGSS